jgi:hypothetical protein
VTEIERLKAIEKAMLASPDQRVSLADADACSMAPRSAADPEQKSMPQYLVADSSRVGPNI